MGELLECYHRPYDHPFATTHCGAQTRPITNNPVRHTAAMRKHAPDAKDIMEQSHPSRPRQAMSARGTGATPESSPKHNPGVQRIDAARAGVGCPQHKRCTEGPAGKLA